MTGAERDSAEATYLRADSALQSARDDVRLRQASLRQRRSELKLARQQLADTTVRSPIDGVVQQRLANAGEFLAAGAPVAEIVRVDLLRLKYSTYQYTQSHSELAHKLWNRKDQRGYVE